MSEPTEHTLYCIGGSLDGQVRTEQNGFSMVRPGARLWVPGYDDDDLANPRHGSDFYELRKLEKDGHEVQFWVRSGLDLSYVLHRARELFTASAILADEQQIHT